MKVLKGVYLITGATGFIGSLIVKVLLENPDYLKGNIKIIGFVRDIEKAQRIYKNYNNNYLKFISSDILNFAQSLEKYIIDTKENAWIPDYIFHCAAITKSEMMIANPVETGDGIVLGTRNVLEGVRTLKIKSMVYLSSMEVYGKVDDMGTLVTEEMLGDLNIFSARSCYPLGKRMAEQYCYSYCYEYGVPVKIARLAQTFGTGILPGENRVFAQFAKAVQENSNIVLHTDGKTMGNYCDSKDAVRALFLLLYEGLNGEAYNIVNEANTMSIRNMAKLVVDRIAHGKIEIVYEIPEENKYGYATDTGLRLSSEKLRALGWKSTKNIEEMFLDMIEWMNMDYSD